MRAIEIETYARVVSPSSFGRPPRLEWLAIRDLIVDADYQREITRLGRTNIRNIAAAFNWSMFSTVIVAAAGGNKFAIVDGQHRVTAAAICGIEKVPCAIVECTRGEQAAAFRAINTNTTRLHTVQLFHAALLAGEAAAKVIAAICEVSGIEVPRYKSPHLAARQTFAVKTIGRCAAKFGDAVTIAALSVIAESSGDDNGNTLRQSIIHGVAEVLADHPEWCGNQRALSAAFESIDLLTLRDEAASIAARTRGTSTLNQFEARLIEQLDRHFKRRRSAGRGQ